MASIGSRGNQERRGLYKGNGKGKVGRMRKLWREAFI